MSPSHPVRPLPSVRRRVLLGLGAAAVPAAVLGLPEVADAVPAGPAAPAEPVLPLEPVDPAVTGGETVILDQVLADLAPVTDDPDGPLRRIEDVAATMIGCTWQGEAPEEVWVRGRAEDGTWSPWLEAERAFDPETGDAADGTEPSWLGGSFAVDVHASRGGEDVTGELTAHIVTTSPPQAGRRDRAVHRRGRRRRNGPRRRRRRDLLDGGHQHRAQRADRHLPRAVGSR